MRFTVTALGGARRTVDKSVRGIVKYLLPDPPRPGQGSPEASSEVGGPATYYADRGEAPGRWLGRDATVLGLVGPVDGGDLARVLSGRDPANGERLIHARGSAGRRKPLGVGSATRLDDTGEPTYDVHDAAAALDLEPDELDRLVAAGVELAASRIFGVLSRGGNPGSRPGMNEGPEAVAYLVPVIGPNGERWLGDAELERFEVARDDGPDIDAVVGRGEPDDLVPLAEAADLAGVTPQHLRALALDYERNQASFDEVLAAGKSPRRGYIVGVRGPRRRWYVRRDELAAYIERRRKRLPPVRVGFDLTFTMEKSFSVLALLAEPAMGRRVLDTIEDVNDQALRWLEEQAARVRVKDEIVPADGWMVASFRHLTSRALDPFAHWHNVVANTAVGPDGRRRALDARWMYAHAQAASALATADARWRFTTELAVRWRPARKGGWEIAGIDDEVLDDFSQRRNEVDEALKELENALTDGVSPKDIEKVVLDTRPAKQHAPVEELRAEWWRRASNLGLTPAGLTAATVGERTPPPEPPEHWLHATLAAPTGICSHLSLFDYGDLLSTLVDLPVPPTEGPGGTAEPQPLLVSADRLRELADAFLASPHVVAVAGGENPVYTTTEILKVQERIVARSRTGTTGDVPAAKVQRPTIGAVLDTHDHLTFEQRQFVGKLCHSGLAVQCGIGFPGAGKTTSMAAARDAWQAAGFRVMGAAVKGEAARLLAEDAGIETETVAWWLAHEDPGSLPLDDRTVLVVDEASTLSDRDLDRLMWQCDQAGAALRLIGDPQQHGAVEAGGMFRVLCERFAASTPMITETHRVRDPRDRAAAELLRAGRVSDAFDQLDLAGHLHIVDDEVDFYRQLLARWWDARRQGKDHPMVDGRNSVRRHLNRLAHRLLQAALEVGMAEIDSADDRRFAVGDRVIARRPARHLHPEGRPKAYVRNGSTGVVTAVVRGRVRSEDAIEVSIDGIGHVRFTRQDFDEQQVAPGAVDVGLDHAYAVTSYAVQGSTRAVSTSRLDDRSTRAEMLVDITRGREANHVYLTRADGDPLDGEYLPRLPPPPVDEAVADRLTRSKGEVTAWELVNPPDRSDTSLTHGTRSPSLPATSGLRV